MNVLWRLCNARLDCVPPAVTEVPHGNAWEEAACSTRWCVVTAYLAAWSDVGVNSASLPVVAPILQQCHIRLHTVVPMPLSLSSMQGSTRQGACNPAAEGALSGLEIRCAPKEGMHGMRHMCWACMTDGGCTAACH